MSRVSNMYDISIRYIWVLVLALFLTACGDQCFQEVQFPAGSPPYIQKNAQIKVPANSSDFISTESMNIIIPQGSEVTMQITGGPIFLCGNDHGTVSIPANQQQWTEILGPGIIPNVATVVGDTVNFFVGCDPDDYTQPVCNTVSCSPSTQAINCAQAQPGTNICQGSTTKVIPACTQCFQYNSSNILEACTYGGASDTQCVYNCTQQLCSYPAQSFYNKKSCLNLYNSGPYTLALNQWNWINNKNAVNNFCQIQNYDLAFSSAVTPANLYKYIGDGKNNNASNNCWYTAGMGLALKIITDSSAQSCQDSGNETWFIHNPLSVSDSSITNDSGDFTLIRCSGTTGIGFQNCANNLKNTIVERIIQQQAAKFYCMKLIDENGYYGDNLGGYNVSFKAQRCLAQGGYPIEGLPTTSSPIGALEFKTSQTGDSQLVIDQKMTDANGATISPTSSSAQYFTTDSFGQAAPMLFRIKDNANDYSNNQGSYTVNLAWKEYVAGSGTISNTIQKLRDDLRNVVLRELPQYYCKSTCTSGTCTDSTGVCTNSYMKYIRALLVLYIIFYGFSFIMGFTSISQKDLLIRLIKIGVVLQLISPGSWDFFNNHLFALFLNSTDQLINYATFTSCGGDTGVTCPPVFSFIDKMFDLLFLDKAIWIKILSIFFISPEALVLGVLLLIGLFYFLIGILAAVAEYLLSIIAVAALLLLGPIFIPFILFEKTREMFDTWIKMLFRYAMEPVFLIIGLSFLFEMYYALFREMFQFNACWKCMWGMNFPSSLTSIINKIFHIDGSFLCVQGFGPWGMAPSGGGSPSGALGLDLPGLLLIIILSAVVRNYTKFVSGVMTQLIGQRASIWKMTGGKRQRLDSAGEGVLKSLGVDKAEKAVNKAVRKNVFQAFGLKTGDKEEQEKELEKYEQSLGGGSNAIPGGTANRGNVGGAGKVGGQAPKGGGGTAPRGASSSTSGTNPRGGV